LKLGFLCALAAAACLLPARLRAKPAADTAVSAADAPLAADTERSDHGDADVEALLRDQALRARSYRYAWTGINAALAVGSFAVIPLIDHAHREDYVVNGIASLVGMATTLALPLQVEGDEPALSASAALPPAERHKRLRALLDDGARDEHARVTWPWHALNLGTSALAGGIIAVGFGHTEDGVLTGIAGFILGEAQILTQPTALRAARSSEGAMSRLHWQPSVSCAQRGFSFGLEASF
jgi:hypothetical protein